MASSSEELFELILRVQGEEKVAKLTAELAAAERQLQDVAAAAALTGQSLSASELAPFAQAVANLKGQLSAAESTLNQFGAAERQAAAAAEAAAAKVQAANEKKAAAARAAASAAEASASRAAAATVMEAAQEEAAATKQIAARARVQAALNAAMNNPTQGGAMASIVATTTGNSAQKIVMQVIGQEKVQLLNQAIQMETASIQQLNAQLQRGQITQAAFAASAGGSAVKINAAQREIKAIGASTGISGYRMQQFAQTLDDLQYVGEMGLRPIINNLMQMNPVLGIAALGIDLVWRHWGSLMRLMDVGLPQPALEGPELLAANLKKATTEMENLQKKTTLTWFEVARLKKLQEDTKEMKQKQKDDTALENMLDGQSERQKEVGGGVKKALDESGGADAKFELSRELGFGKDAKGLVFDPVTRKMTTPDEAAGNLIRTAGQGDEQSRAEIMKILPEHSIFRQNIDKFSPETKEAKDKADAASDEEYEASQDKIKRMQETKKKENAEAKDIASDILKGKNANRFISGNANDEDVNAELKQLGLRTDDPLLRERVKRFAEQKAGEMGAAEATEEGLSSPEAGRNSLIAKNKKKEADDHKKEIDKQVDAVTTANPELPDLLKNSIKGGVAGGQSLAAAQNDLLYQLADKFGPEVAKSLLTDAGADAKKEMVGDYLGEKTMKSENATVINGASSLRDTIQGSVKSPEVDELKKANQTLDRSRELLEELVRNPSGGLA